MATYRWPEVSTNEKFFKVSFTEVLFDAAIPIFTVLPAGSVTNGVAVRNAKLSNVSVPFT